MKRLLPWLRPQSSSVESSSADKRRASSGGTRRLSLPIRLPFSLQPSLLRSRRMSELAFSLLLLALIPFLSAANYTSWWTNRNVVTTGAMTNDYAAVNQGQVKHMATQAYAEFQSNLAGGAGTNLTALINSLSLTNANYAPVTIGQLKNLAQPFYDRLIAVGYVTNYPWSGAPPSAVNDYAAANIGQVKNLFSFDLAGWSGGGGLPAAWQIQYFGQIGVDPNADPDNDGLTNLQEYQAGTDPTNAGPPLVTILSPTNGQEFVFE